MQKTSEILKSPFLQVLAIVKMVYECVDDDDFEKHLNESGSKPVIVDFYTSWCGPCKLVAPRFEEYANNYSDKMIFLKVDVDKCEG